MEGAVQEGESLYAVWQILQDWLGRRVGKKLRGALRSTSACRRPPIASARPSLRLLRAAHRGRSCAKKAWRLLQGASPCRVRISHPPVSSLASMAESW